MDPEYKKGFTKGIIGGLIIGLVFLITCVIFWQIGIYKPAIYLYPTEPTTVSVKLITTAKITKSIPAYTGEWIVFATPEGRIDSKYDYLYYEADASGKVNVKDGWVIEKNQLPKWFDEYLPKLGLNEREKSDFMDYWLYNLPDADYYLVAALSQEEIDNLVKLEITPKPDTTIRVMLYFKPLSQKIQIEEPKISTPERKGFVAVEWGGIMDK